MTEAALDTKGLRGRKDLPVATNGTGVSKDGERRDASRSTVQEELLPLRLSTHIPRVERLCRW